MNTLLNKTNSYDLSPKTLCQLFDSFVLRILNYGCEIWGFTKNKAIETIHLKFCKLIMNVKCSTSNAGIYGELARFPLYITRYVRIVKYWLPVINTDNCILNRLYTSSLMDCNNGMLNWTTSIKQLLYEHGFGYVWEDPTSLHP